MSEDNIIIEPGSYKDPEGTVFYLNNKVYRYVEDGKFQFFAEFIKAEYFRKLVHDGCLIDTTQVDLKDNKEVLERFGKESFFEHQKINFISYPYEWSFSMCLDAALLTLTLQKQLLQNDLSLKDAVPYNVQFVHSKPIFIDLCSIERISDNAVWIAYSQFCQMFLYPLLLYIHRGIALKDIYLSNIGGISLENTYKTIGFRAKLKPSLFTNLVLPRLLLSLFKKIKMLDQKAGELTRNMPNNKEIQLNAIRKLEKLIIGFKKERYSSHWASYHRTNSYGDASEKAKMKYVGGIFKRINIQRVLDIGCNTGVYSKIAAANGADVVAIDSDHDCIDVLYKDVRNSGAHILPLCVDISSPSPSIGWLNKERKSFLERADFDCVLSLALIHHLLISGRHPLPQIVDLMSDLTQKYLITEYIGDNDSMFKQLMLNRKETYEFYDLEYFKKEHLVKFNILDELALPEMDRRLFLMEKKEQ